MGLMQEQKKKDDALNWLVKHKIPVEKEEPAIEVLDEKTSEQKKPFVIPY